MQYPDGDVLGLFGGSGTQLGYDQAGRLSSIPGVLTSVTYNSLGAPMVQTNANGTTTTRSYDANRFWLEGIDTTAPSLTLQDLSYTLNDAGMATEVTSPFGTEGWTYGYDELNRLTSSTNTGASANNQTWTYDSLGRITNNSRIGNYTYGGSRPHAVTAAGSNTYTSYDQNGNLLAGGGRTLTWNANNLITQVVMGGNTTSFTYGPDGDRIKKTSGANVSKYPFGDDYEVGPGGTVTKYFSAGFGVIAKKVGSTLYWLHTDRLGSINATTDAGGAEVLRRSYRSYGELLGQTGTHTESLDYIGQRTDSETGLTYLHARYYDPALGTFLSPDPIGADSNTYRYSFGDSVNFGDPSGLCGETVTGTDNAGRPYGPLHGVDCGQGDFRNFWWYLAHSTPDPEPRGPRDPRDPCSISPTHPRCTERREPECDKSDPNGPCYVEIERPGCGQGVAAQNGTCEPKPPEGCNPLKPCPNAPDMTPTDRKEAQDAFFDLLTRSQNSPTCGALFGPDLEDWMRKATYRRVQDPRGSSWSPSTNTVNLNDFFFSYGNQFVRFGDNSRGLFTSDLARRALTLGHEHGHQMGILPSDALSDFQSGRNSQRVYAACFS